LTDEIEIIPPSAEVGIVIGGVAQAGPPGADGAGATNNILYGSGIPSAGTGNNGNFYIDTTAWDIYGPKAAGTWPAGVSLIGPAGAEGADGAAGGQGIQGNPGADGKTVLNGTGAPSNGTGTNGDFYIATDTSMLYGPKAGGVWPAGVSLIGPQGIQGNPGSPGSNGADGADGADGQDGRTLLNGSGAPAGGTGADGDFYIDTATYQLYGPKTAGAWGSPFDLAGADGTTLRYGAGAPSGGLGANGEFYINTSNWTIYGPKTAGDWGSPTSLLGATGAQGDPGADGADGNTVLSGSAAPTGGIGVDGDWYIRTGSWLLYGPKAAGTWPTGVSLIGPQGDQGIQGNPGADGADGIDGLTVRSGADAPAGGLGVNGDFYIRTSNWTIYGPKTAGDWGSPTNLIGANGSNGTNGLSVLNGSGAPDSGLGANGDFYIDTAAWNIYGPKTAGAWGSPTSLIGAAGSNGSNGADGADGLTVLSGSAAPTTEGVNGDFYIRTGTWTIYGPKTAGAWGSPTSLVGPSGGSFDSTSVPTPAAGQAKPYLLDRATKLFPVLNGPDADKTPLMQWGGIPLKSIKWWKATNNLSTPAVVGGFGNSVTGSAGAHTMVATDGIRGYVPKNTYTTAVTNNAAAGTRHAVSEFWRGGAAGEGGFLYGCRFGGRANFDDANSGTRAYVGLHGVNSVISGGTEPSNLTSTIGMAKDGTDTNWQIIHNDSSGTCTKIDLGANFPANTNYADIYDVWFYAKPNDSNVYYYVERRDATTMAVSHTASGTINTDLPATSTRLSPQVWCCTGSPTPLAVGFDVYFQVIETEY